MPLDYDGDGLLTQASDLAIARDLLSGRISGTTLSGITTSHTYNAFGEPAEFRAQTGTSDLLQVTYTQDDGGRRTAGARTRTGNWGEAPGHLGSPPALLGPVTGNSAEAVEIIIPGLEE